jgi:hypothetical protein
VMGATNNQIELIEILLETGATMECDDKGNPDTSFYDSVELADKFIKKWGNLARSPSFKTKRPPKRFMNWYDCPKS